MSTVRAWLDDNDQVVILQGHDHGGTVSKDRAIPDSWKPLVEAGEARAVAKYAGVDMSRFTIEWLIEPDTTGMGPWEKIRTLAYKERIPVGTLLFDRPEGAEALLEKMREIWVRRVHDLVPPLTAEEIKWADEYVAYLKDRKHG